MFTKTIRIVGMVDGKRKNEMERSRNKERFLLGMSRTSGQIYCIVSFGQ